MLIKPYNMKKILIILILVLGVVTLVGAQENASGEFNNGATCQKFKFSLNFGRAFSNSNTIVLDASTYNSYSSSVQPVVPYVYGINQYDNPSTNMIGVEFRWMFKPLWSLNLSGLGILTANPAQDAIMGIPDLTPGSGSLKSTSPSTDFIPTINSVGLEADFDWSMEVGVSRYFDLPNKKLLPYLGFSFLYAHGSDRYEVPMSSYDLEGNVLPADLRGMQRGEVLTWGFAVPVGFEYYVSEGLFIGASIHAVNYFYSLAQFNVGEGMDLARADNSTFSFLTRPMLKIGIAF